jgi:hypothetical protein
LHFLLTSGTLQVSNPALDEVIVWSNFDRGLFVIRDQEKLAQLWGQFKKKRYTDYASFSSVFFALINYLHTF